MNTTPQVIVIAALLLVIAVATATSAVVDVLNRRDAREVAAAVGYAS